MLEQLKQSLAVATDELGFLDQLSADDASKLQGLFMQAHENQKQQVNQAIDAGLQIIPGFLRKSVRRILGDS